MDVQEALITMAILMNNEAEYYYNYLKKYEDTNDIFNEEYQKRLKEYEWIKKNTIEFGNRLAAIPMFFNILESWKVCIIGKEGLNEDIKENISKEEKEELLDKCSNIASSIKKFLKSLNVIVYSEIGIGRDGWDISIICTEKDSKILCEAIYKKFYYAIEKNILYLSRRFIGHHIPGLYNWDDAKKIITLLNIK
jgi:hypothetical protein